MNVFVISRGVPSKKEPMWGIFELDQAGALKNYGHNVTVLSIDTRARFIYRKLGVTRRIYNNVECYDLYVPLPYFLLPAKLYIYVVQLLLSYLYKRVIKKSGVPSVVHAHYAFGMAYASIIKKKFGIPLVGTEHWSIMGGHLSKRAKAYVAEGYSHVDKFIAVSSSLSKRMFEAYNIHSVVISNVVDVRTFNGCVRKKRTGDEFRFVSVGGLINRKGFDLLIEAFSRANFDKQVKLDIYGGGELLPDLQRQIDSLGLCGQVCLCGSCSRAEIASYFANSDAFVLSSRSETFGVVCIEALVSGLPVIATVCGGPEEFVDESNGILVPVDDVKALTNALVEMRNNTQQYNTAGIIENCLNRFSPQIIAQQISDVYSSLFDQCKT